MKSFIPIALLFLPLSALAAGAPVTVTVTAKGCEPAELTVPAGETTFLIINKSTRAMEWEILSGVMVVDERENIAPGFKQKMTTDLKPGEYAVTCGLLSNPQGKLIVANAGAPAGPVKPTATDLIGPTAEYRVFLAGETDGLVKAANAHAEALAAGDSARADAMLGLAQSRFDHIRPAIGEGGAAFDQTLAQAASGAATGRIADDAKALQMRVMTTPLTPVAMVKGMLIILARTANDAEHDRKANIEGARKIVDLMQPLLVHADSALGDQLKADLQAVDAALNGGDRVAADTALRSLAADAEKLMLALGLE